MTKDSIVIDTKQLDRLVIELKGFEKQVGEAYYHALNRTLDQVVTHVGRIVPKEYAIKASEVKKSFRNGFRRPSKTKLNASIESKGHTLSLAHFPHSPQRPKKGKYKVKATIKRGSRKTIITNPPAFLAPTGAASEEKTQYNVFRRVGQARLPIKVIRTLSIPQMITNEKVSNDIYEFANEKLADRMEHELIYRMTSIGKKIGR